MLGGDEDAGNANRSVAFVDDRDLRLGVGTQPVEVPTAPIVGEALGELVRQDDRQRHELGALGRGIAEHDALVAGALLLLVVGGLHHARVDLARLLRDEHRDLHAVGVELLGRVRVADFANRLARDGLVVERAVGGDFTGQHDVVVLAEDFAGDVARSVLREAGIENRVGDVVADFVRMPFRHRLGRERVGLMAHVSALVPPAKPRTKDKRLARLSVASLWSAT